MTQYENETEQYLRWGGGWGGGRRYGGYGRRGWGGYRRGWGGGYRRG
jgi:hypothetical protein